MVNIRRTNAIPSLVGIAFVSNVMGQVDSNDQSSSVPSSQISSITSASSASSTGTYSDNSGLIGSLWAGGESLLSSVYPSSSYGNVATLTWPSSVVIDSSTVPVPHATTSPSTTAGSASSTSAKSESITSHVTEPTQTPSDPPAAPISNSSGQHKVLGIVLGVVVGVLVLAIVLCIFLVCRRRKRRRERSLRPFESRAGESEIQSWRQPTSHNFASQNPKTYETRAPPQSVFLPTNPYQHATTPYQQLHNPHQNDQAMRSLEGAGPHEGAVSNDNPFYTPEERQNLRSSGSVFNEHARVPHDFANPDRPPTPFASVLFGVPARKPLPPHENRSSNTAVHYPSNSEASDFNFGFGHSKEGDFGDSSESVYHSASGEDWDQQEIHPAYRT